MEMKQCSNGHFYDASRTPECPYCNSASANVNMTRPLEVTRPMDIGATTPLQEKSAPSSQINKTRALNVAGPVNPASNDNEKTVAIMKKEIGLDPVVGWLVCIEGSDKGRDYRIHAQRNFIGRSEKMDICIRGDETISREDQAVISYDTKKNVFRIFPGDGKGIVYLNDEEIFTAEVLKPYDLVEMGNTKLVFIPLCGEQFTWK